MEPLLKICLAWMFMVLFSVAALSPAHAVALKCTAGAGLDCRVDQGDMLFGGVNSSSPNPGGLDNEVNVEAAIQSAGFVFTDLTLLGKSDGGYGSAVSGKSGIWNIPDFANFITVKGANSFNLFAVIPASTSGSWDTLDLTNGGGKQAGVSHISYWSTQGGLPSGGQVPEPATLVLFGTGLVGFGLWRFKKGVPHS